MASSIFTKRRHHKKQTGNMWRKLKHEKVGRVLSGQGEEENRRIWEGFLEEFKEASYQFYSFSWGRQIFSAKGQIVNIWGFVSCMVSVATTQLFCCGAKTQPYTISKWMTVVVFQWKFIYKNSEPDLAHGDHWLIPVVSQAAGTPWNVA